MTSMITQRINGRWHFNGRLYKDIHGKEKQFVDELLNEVDVERISIVRTPNDALKRHNYQFPNKE